MKRKYSLIVRGFEVKNVAAPSLAAAVTNALMMSMFARNFTLSYCISSACLVCTSLWIVVGDLACVHFFL
jgi:hypothetical protein